MSPKSLIWSVLIGLVFWVIALSLMIYARTLFAKVYIKLPWDERVWMAGVLSWCIGAITFFIIFYRAPATVLPEHNWIKVGGCAVVVILCFWFAHVALQVYSVSYRNARKTRSVRRSTA